MDSLYGGVSKRFGRGYDVGLKKLLKSRSRSRASYVGIRSKKQVEGWLEASGVARGEIGSLIVVRPFPSPAKSAGRSCLLPRRSRARFIHSNRCRLL